MALPTVAHNPIYQFGLWIMGQGNKRNGQASVLLSSFVFVSTLLSELHYNTVHDAQRTIPPNLMIRKQKTVLFTLQAFCSANFF